jgi:uncharacterized protein involved in type VI secretion and phage assembly
MLSSPRNVEPHDFGLVEAIVVDNLDPLGQGRVCVKYPRFDGSLTTEWCRVSQPYAGNGFGAFFIPEKNCEVIMAFVQGDRTEAIVLGGLYNGQDQPKAQKKKGSSMDQKAIRTQGEHELLMDDTPSQKCLQLTSSGQQVVLLDDANKLVRITTGQGQTITLEQSSGAITISANGGQSIQLDGQGTITIGGPTTVNVQGGTISLQGGKVELGEAAEQAVVLGDTLLALFNTHTHQLGPFPTTPPVEPLTPAVLSATVTVQP